MSSEDVMPDTTAANRDTPPVRTEQLPGVIFQLHRNQDGHLRFPYLAGRGIRLFGVAPEQLARDARPALARLDEADYPRLMAAIERSMYGQAPIATKFRLLDPEGSPRWIAARAHPEVVATGTLWHGILLDISEQVAEEERLRRLSDTDALTGLPNRRKLLKRLDEKVSLSNRHATPLSLLMIDIDHFKSINDTWGHLQGDKVLSELARLCAGLLREEDLMARLGGEEFAVMLPLISRSQAKRLATRLCEAIAQHDFGLDSLNVTASIGIAEHRIGDSRDGLMRHADAMLYAAKRGGRNRVVAKA